MAQRKYLKVSVFLVAWVLFANTVLATAWVVKKGQYKYTSTLMYIDSKARNNRSNREKIVDELLLERQSLTRIKNNIITKNLAKNRADLSNTDKLILQEIDTEIAQIDRNINKLSKQPADSFANLSVEYGISDFSSLELSILYDQQRFMNKVAFSRSAEFLYKYNLFRNTNWSVTVVPKLKVERHLSSGLGMFFGYSGNKNATIKTFTQVGLLANSDFPYNKHGKKTYGLSIMEGFKIENGLVLNNFSAVSFDKLGKKITEQEYFDQISIAKIINFDSLGRSSLTIQLGYFWKGSFLYRNAIATGPILSLWAIF